MRAGVTFVDKAATETLVVIPLGEARLLNLYKQGTTDPEVLAGELGPKRGAVEKKLERLSLSLQRQTTTTVSSDKNLLTDEQALKILAGALAILAHTQIA